MAALSKFHDHLLNTITAQQMENLVGSAKVKSHKRLNYILRNPYAATLEELLFFAELLKRSPYDMYRHFSVAAETIGARTTTLLLAHHMKKEYAESEAESAALATS